MFIKRLKVLRAKKEISQSALADTLHLSQQAIAKWETGKATPDPTTLIHLADFFEVTVDYLLGRTDEPNEANQIRIIATNRTDNHMNDLPPEAQERVDEFIELMKIKYGKKNP